MATNAQQPKCELQWRSETRGEIAKLRVRWNSCAAATASELYTADAYVHKAVTRVNKSVLFRIKDFFSWLLTLGIFLGTFAVPALP